MGAALCKRGYLVTGVNLSPRQLFVVLRSISVCRGVSRIFERGGSNISWFPKKKVIRFLKGGVQWSEGGGSSTFVSLGRQILHI